MRLHRVASRLVAMNWSSDAPEFSVERLKTTVVSVRFSNIGASCGQVTTMVGCWRDGLLKCSGAAVRFKFLLYRASPEGMTRIMAEGATADLAQRIATVVSGQYQVVRQLGQSSVAVVYLARHLRHDRFVALEFIASRNCSRRPP